MSLNKELGIPGVNEDNGRTVSLSFYYGHISKMCHDHLNRMKMKEATDEAMISIFGEAIEHNKNEPNVYERYEDSYVMPSYVSTFGEHSRERIDHKKAGLRLWLQRNDMQEYNQRRYEFFEKVFLKRDMSDLGNFSSFMDREDIMEINSDLNDLKDTLGRAKTKPTPLLKILYAKAYKNHYEEIVEQIEAYAAYGTQIDKFLSYENIDTVFYIDTGADTVLIHTAYICLFFCLYSTLSSAVESLVVFGLR
jgi:hypothetical protein